MVFSMVFDISRTHSGAHTRNQHYWALVKAAFLQVINPWLFWYTCIYGVSQMVFWGNQEFMKSSMKNSKISTTSWWQRFPVCVHRRDSDGLRPDHLTSLQRFWCLQICSAAPQSSQWEIIHKVLSSAFPSHTSPCLHQINSFRLLHILDSEVKMKDLPFCLLPFGVSWAVGESDLSTPTQNLRFLHQMEMKQVMWPGPRDEMSPVPCSSQSFRSSCGRMEVQLLLMSETEAEHIQNYSEVLSEWSLQCHH